MATSIGELELERQQLLHPGAFEPHTYSRRLLMPTQASGGDGVKNDLLVVMGLLVVLTDVLDQVVTHVRDLLDTVDRLARHVFDEEA